MQNNEISVPAEGGQSFNAYCAVPKGGRSTGIVIAQEIFGVNNALRVTAQDFASRGFVTLVPDLFWRIRPGTDLGYGDADRQQAMQLMGKFDVAQGVKDIGAAVAALRKHPACNGTVAVVGFCLGGTLAYLAAARLGIDVAVSYYGTAIHQNLGEAESVRCPLLLHFAEKDNFVPPEAVANIRATFENRPKVGVHVYPDVGHAFCNIDRPGVYNASMAKLAHERSELFLGQNA